MNISRTPPKIGLALGSGASRGWSHIGVIRELLKDGIEPDIVCGTSVGAIVGGSYVAGNLDKLERWVLESTRSDVLRFFDIGVLKSGFVDAERLDWFLHSYVAAESVRIEDLAKSFAAVSTNLDSGQEIWLSKGVLAEAVRASVAMPGLFPAVRIDQRWLVDGGLVNPVPVSACRALGAEIVIAVNLNSDIIGKRNSRKEESVGIESTGILGNLKQQAREYSASIFANRGSEGEAPGLFYAIANAVNIFQDRITRSRLAGDPADVLISPKVGHIGMLEFHRAGEAIKAGELSVNEGLDEVRRAVGSV
jgi:NTE family protein